MRSPDFQVRVMEAKVPGRVGVRLLLMRSDAAEAGAPEEAHWGILR